MKILLFGVGGQLSTAFMSVLPEGAYSAVGMDVCDVTDADALLAQLTHHKPTCVINATAYTAVDKAESEPDMAYAINATAPEIMARWCKEHDAVFVHYSTEYVFDGSGCDKWREDDIPHPLNLYGKSKYAGEEAIERIGGKYLIFRTSWLYSPFAHNFALTMLRLAKEKTSLNIVADQSGAPTYVPHLAEACWQAIETAQQMEVFPSGLYHLCHQGESSWHGFATAIFKAAIERGAALAIQEVTPIATAQYPTPARRPLNSRLDCTKASAMLKVQLPAWEEGLEAFIAHVFPADHEAHSLTASSQALS